MLVLVVDDDPAIRALVSSVLRMEDFDVVDVEGGPAALSAIDAGLAPDAIVMDLAMPRMTGHELFPLMRERGCTAPVLVLSAFGAGAAASALGAEAAPQKPFDIDDLVHVVRSLVEAESEAAGARRSRSRRGLVSLVPETAIGAMLDQRVESAQSTVMCIVARSSATCSVSSATRPPCSM